MVISLQHIVSVLDWIIQACDQNMHTYTILGEYTIQVHLMNKSSKHFNSLRKYKAYYQRSNLPMRLPMFIIHLPHKLPIPIPISLSIFQEDETKICILYKSTCILISIFIFSFSHVS